MVIFIDGKYAIDDISNFYRKSEYGGNKSISFEISTKHKYYKYISEDCSIICDNETYSIKTINERKNAAIITANLDLWEFHSIVYSEFVTETVSLNDTLNKALKNTNWSWKYYDSSHSVTKKRSLKLNDCDVMDILQYLTNTTSFDIFYQFDTKNKIITIFSSSVGNDKGVFFTDELNLSEMTFKGSSDKLITRIYPYGKDGLNIKSVNNGIEYVENLTYSNKIISAIWRDERYTNAENLIEDAITKLEISAFPVRSYTCKILDLAKLAADKYSNLSFELYDIVTLIDRQRQTRVKHRITEIKEYLNEPKRNEITLSSVTEKITTKLDTINNNISNINNTIITSANNVSNKLTEDIKNATTLITGNNGGYVLIHTDENNKPYEILIMDTDNIDTAQNIWRLNTGGIGHSSNGYNGDYTTAMTMDGAIVADIITAGTLQGIKIIADNGKVGGWNITADGLQSPDGMLSFSMNNNTPSIDMKIDYGDKIYKIAEIINTGIKFYKRDGTVAGSFEYHKEYDWVTLESIENIDTKNIKAENADIGYLRLVQNDNRVTVSLKTKTLSDGSTITYLGVD